MPIRLTHERWAHITEEHNEMAVVRLEVLETVAQPDRILEGQYVRCLRFGRLSPGAG